MNTEILAQFELDRFVHFIERFGSMAILALLLWLIFARWLPRQDRANRETLEKISDQSHAVAARQTDVIIKLEASISSHVAREELLLERLAQTLDQIAKNQNRLNDRIERQLEGRTRSTEKDG